MFIIYKNAITDPTATANAIDDTTTWLPELAESVVVPFAAPGVPMRSVSFDPKVPSDPASVAEPFAVASLPPTFKFATITFSALSSCPSPDVPSHSLLLQSLPHVRPSSPPEHCAAAPLADVRKMKSICDWRSEAAAADWDCAAAVMLAMLETLEAVAVVGREVIRDRVCARARARMAR